MFTLIKKELSYYFNNPIGYLIAIIFAVFVNFLFVKDLFLRGESNMRPFFEIMPWLCVVFVPALAMRIFSEEKRLNTIEVLLTLPITETMIVLAKFIALLIFAFFTLSLTFSLPLTLIFIGRPFLPEIIVAYLGVFFMMAAFISLSMFFSSTTKNQIVSFLTSAITLFFLILLGSDFFSSFLPSLITQNLSYFSFYFHFANFLKGVVDIRSVVYFLSIIFLFLFFTIVNLEKRD